LGVYQKNSVRLHKSRSPPALTDRNSASAPLQGGRAATRPSSARLN
jgi:hypothetical protein